MIIHSVHNKPTLAPGFYMASYAISSKLHFTLHHDYAYC